MMALPMAVVAVLWVPSVAVPVHETSYQATPTVAADGFLFYRSRIRGAAAAGTTNLGRPWRPDAQAVNYTPQRYLAGTDGWNPVG